jgi:hypothetical protein
MNFGFSSFYHGTTVGAGSPKVQGFFFVANFRHMATKKKGAGKSNKGIFENFLLKKSPYLEEKKS